MYYHAIATLPGGRRKSIVNKSEDQMLTEFVIPYERTGVIKARWGVKLQSYQVLELRIFGTEKAWSKLSGTPLDDFLRYARDRYATFKKRAKRALFPTAHRVFVIMPIQGEQYGSQDEQRIWKEYDARFETIESLLGKYDAVAIRIDKEHALEELVRRIKEEIEKSKFIVADLTDERPSCYYEAGYAEALQKPVLFVASKESVVNPKTVTKIHFDIHRNVNYFINNEQLRQKLKAALDKNREQLFGEGDDGSSGLGKRPPLARTALPPVRSAGREVSSKSSTTGAHSLRSPFDFNEKERAVLQTLASASAPMHLADVASIAFPTTKSAKANSWVRNSVRRPLRFGLIGKTERGIYSPTVHGRKAIQRSS